VSIGVKWTGWDGSVWDLVEGPVRLMTGTEDLFNMHEAEVAVRETSMRDGQTVTGWRMPARSGLLPVALGRAATELEWLELERAWWRTMRPNKVGSLELTAPDGSRRRIGLRFQNAGGMKFERDPSPGRLTVAPLRMVADDPWWLGDPFVRSFDKGTTPVNFFGPTGFGPPFFISGADTTDSATITNPGDADSWPTYVFEGPISQFSIAIGGQVLAGSIDVPVGAQLVIYTSQDRQIAWLMSGTSAEKVTNQLDSYGFARVPPGESVGLTISFAGTGSLTVTGDTRYYKGWG
jgi:hypothetical protein